MKGVTKKMQNALFTNFDTDVSVAAKVYGSQGGAGGTKEFNVVIPLNIDGRKITEVVSRVQYDSIQQGARNRGDDMSKIYLINGESRTAIAGFIYGKVRDALDTENTMELTSGERANSR